MKKKKTLFIIIPILIIITIGVTIGVLYFTTDMFKNNYKETFWNYFSQNQQILSVLENENLTEQKQLKESNTYQTNGELNITVQEGGNTQGVKFITNGRHDANTNRSYVEASLKQGENDLIKVSYVNNDDIYAIKSDDIITNYIGIQNSNLKQFINKISDQTAGNNAYEIPDSIEFNILDKVFELSEEEKQYIVNTYILEFINAIPEQNYSSLGQTQETIDGSTYTTDVYQVYADAQTVKNIVVNNLTKLKEDTKTLLLFSNKLSMLGLGSQYTDTSNISNTINNIINQVQNNSIKIEGITITIYVYDGKTIQTVINSEDGINKLTINNISQGNTQKASILIDKMINYVDDSATTEKTLTKLVTSQINVEKTVTNNNIIIETTYIPDISNTSNQLTINNSILKSENNTFNNTTETTLNTLSENNNTIETIKSSYTQNVQFIDQIEEIMEINNTNTVIINNYSAEQLKPFLESLKTRIEQVLNSKLTNTQQTQQQNQNETNNNENQTPNEINNNQTTNTQPITETESNIISILKNSVSKLFNSEKTGENVIITSGISIANTYDSRASIIANVIAILAEENNQKTIVGSQNEQEGGETRRNTKCRSTINKCHLRIL